MPGSPLANPDSSSDWEGPFLLSAVFSVCFIITSLIIEYVGFPTAQEQRSAKYYQPPAMPSKTKYLTSPAQSSEVEEYAAVLQTDDCTGGSTGDSGLDERHSWKQHMSNPPADRKKGKFRCILLSLYAPKCQLQGYRCRNILAQ